MDGWMDIHPCTHPYTYIPIYIHVIYIIYVHVYPLMHQTKGLLNYGS